MDMMSKNERHEEYVRWAIDICNMRYALYRKARKFEIRMQEEQRYIDELEALLRETIEYYKDENVDHILND